MYILQLFEETWQVPTVVEYYNSRENAVFALNVLCKTEEEEDKMPGEWFHFEDVPGNVLLKVSFSHSMVLLSKVETLDSVIEALREKATTEG